MKQSILASSLVLCSFFGTQVYADEICQQKGTVLSCEQGQVDQIVNTGGVRLKGTEVTDKVLVTGSFKAQLAKLNDVTITGSTEMIDSEVAGQLQITGTTKTTDSTYHGNAQVTGKFSSVGDTFEQPLEVTGQFDAESSQYQSELRITAREMNLISVNANNITVFKSSSSNPKQSMYLRDNTQINGDIVFEGGNGLVFMSGGSAVAGEIIGAEVYQGGF